MKNKILKSEYDTCLRVLKQLNNSPSHIQKTIDYLSKVDTLKDLIPKTKTMYISITEESGKIRKDRVKINKVIIIYGEFFCLHKYKNLHTLSHYNTGIQLKCNKFKLPVITFIENTIESVKSESIGEKLLKQQIEKFPVINTEPLEIKK